ncbi:MAG: AMP-binding protein, partial [Betaproteobacteria bacterium]|nr:AMP-binding protein [Betaproteobacteria bacterium]
MNLAELLARSARSQPERTAVAVGGRAVLSYGRLSERASALAHALKQRFGLAPGERVAIAMRNCPQYFEVLFACWHAGLVAVPMNAKLHAKEFAYIVGNSGAKLCFRSEDIDVEGIVAPSAEYESLFSEAATMAQVRPDHPAWLFYTSGTTGVPKGAMLTHRNLLFATQAYFSDIDELEPEDAILHAAPLSHGSGLYALPHLAAGAVNVIPEGGHFDA